MACVFPHNTPLVRRLVVDTVPQNRAIPHSALSHYPITRFHTQTARTAVSCSSVVLLRIRNLTLKPLPTHCAPRLLPPPRPTRRAALLMGVRDSGEPPPRQKPAYVPDPRDDADPLAPPRELRAAAFEKFAETYDLRHSRLALMNAMVHDYDNAQGAAAGAASNGSPGLGGGSYPGAAPANANVDSATRVSFERRSDLFLLAFLRCKKMDVRRAFDEYVNFSRAHTENGWLRDVDPALAMRLFETGSLLVLPRYDVQGRLILSLDCKALIPIADELGKQRVLEVVKSIFCVLELLMMDFRAQIFGVVVVGDLTGAKLRTLGYMSISQYQLALNLCQHCYPIRASGMYIIHEPWYIRSLLNVLRPFMKPKVKNCFLAFGTNPSLIHDYIPRESLPAVYGGSLSFDVRTHAVTWVREVQKLNSNSPKL